MRNASTLAVHAVALTAVLGGTTGYLNLDRTVTISVDGESREVSGFARTVGAVLHSEGIAVGPHDTVSPALTTTLEDHSSIAVRHGRELVVTVDGAQRRVWTTAKTVDEALDSMGMRDQQAYVSVSRSQPIGREGLNLAVRTAKGVTIVDAGARTTLMTTALTLGDALAEAGIAAPDADDKVVGNLAAAPTNGSRVVIDRVLTTQVLGTGPVAFATVKRADASLARGTTKVVAAGQPGSRRSTWSFTYVNGKQSGKRLVGTVIATQPKPQVLAVGTKAPATAVSRGFARAGVGGGLNWAGLARCESGGNPRAVSSSGYYGLYQFNLGTWRAVGGSGNPTQASASEQTARAQRLYSMRGTSPWPVCGRNL